MRFAIALLALGLLLALFPTACVDLAIRTGILVEKTR